MSVKTNPLVVATDVIGDRVLVSSQEGIPGCTNTNPRKQSQASRGFIKRENITVHSRWRESGQAQEKGQRPGVVGIFESEFVHLKVGVNLFLLDLMLRSSEF